MELIKHFRVYQEEQRGQKNDEWCSTFGFGLSVERFSSGHQSEKAKKCAIKKEGKAQLLKELKSISCFRQCKGTTMREEESTVENGKS